jgi:hypothetical protein
MGAGVTHETWPKPFGERTLRRAARQTWTAAHQPRSLPSHVSVDGAVSRGERQVQRRRVLFAFHQMTIEKRFAGGDRARSNRMKVSRVRLCLAFPLMFVWGLLAPACDEGSPQYGVRSPLLRLVPDVGNVPSAGGHVFVLTELSMGESKLTGASVLTVFRTAGATARPLPGAPTCPPPNRVEASVGGAPAFDLPLGGSGGEGDGTRPEASPSDFATPFSAFLLETSRNAYETGIVVDVPAGDKDVLVIAAAYEVTGDGTRCPDAIENLLGIATLRIERSSGDDGSGGSSDSIGGQPPNPDDGGAGGVGGAGGAAGAGGTGGAGGVAGATEGGASGGQGGQATGGATGGEPANTAGDGAGR